MYLNKYRDKNLISELPDVSFGVGGINVLQENEQESHQNGYSGENWKDSYIVIAYDKVLGDPYFVDASIDGMPVYTASHGREWKPHMVSSTIEQFIQCIDLFKSLSVGRENPAALKGNKVGIFTKFKLLKKIRSIDSGAPLQR